MEKVTFTSAGIGPFEGELVEGAGGVYTLEFADLRGIDGVFPDMAASAFTVMREGQPDLELMPTGSGNLITLSTDRLTATGKFELRRR